jgi:hypothetical protein
MRSSDAVKFPALGVAIAAWSRLSSLKKNAKNSNRSADAVSLARSPPQMS